MEDASQPAAGFFTCMWGKVEKCPNIAKITKKSRKRVELSFVLTFHPFASILKANRG
jgi:hypothetical protein